MTSPDREVWEEWCKVAAMTKSDASRCFRLEAQEALVAAQAAKHAAVAGTDSAGGASAVRDRVYSLSSEVSQMTKSVMTAHSGSAMVSPIAKRASQPALPQGAAVPAGGLPNRRLNVALGPLQGEVSLPRRFRSQLAKESEPDPSVAAHVAAAPSRIATPLTSSFQTPTKLGEAGAEEAEEGGEADAGDLDAGTPGPDGREGRAWPRAVRGQVLKLCTGHGWQPRYMRVAPWEKLFMYMRKREDREPRVALELDSTVAVADGGTIVRKWPGEAAKREGYEFIVSSSVGRMRFVVLSAKRRELWVGAIRWAIARDRPLRPRGKLPPLAAPAEAGADFASPVSTQGATSASAPSAQVREAAAVALAGDDELPRAEDGGAAFDAAPAAFAAFAAPAAPARPAPEAAPVAAAPHPPADPADPGPVATEGVPAWVRAAGEAQIRELLDIVAERNLPANWAPISSDQPGLKLYSATGQHAGGRGDSVVPWPPSMVLDLLQAKREVVDDQLESHSQVAEYTLHYTISHLRYKTPSMLVSRREFVTMTHWRVIGAKDAASYGVPPGTLVLAASSKRIERVADKVVPAPGHVRGFVFIGGWVLRPRAPSGPGNAVVDATYMSTLDPMGSIPPWVASVSTRKQGALAHRISTILAKEHGAASFSSLHGPRTSPSIVRNLGWVEPPTSVPSTVRTPQDAKPAAPEASGAAGLHTASTAKQPAAPGSAIRAAALPTAAASAAAPAASTDGRAPPAELFEPQESLTLPAEDQPHLARPHRCNPASALVLLLPVLAWLLAALAAPSAFAPPPLGAPADVVHLPAPPAFLLDPARRICAAVAVAARVRAGVDLPAWLAPASEASAAARSSGLDAALAAVPGLGLLVSGVDAATAVHVVVLACAIFALRALYRAWVGPAWMSSRQKFAIASWNPPMEGNMQGALTLDATKALEWIQRCRAAAGESGAKVTLTHVIIKAVGLGLRACPQINGRIVLGEFLPAGSVDVGCLVALDRVEANGVTAKDLAYTKIADADTKTVGGIAGDVARAADRLRSHKDKDFESSKGATRLLPTWLLRPVTHWLGWLSSAAGVSLPFVGVRAFPIGSCMVTAVGGLGLDVAYAPFTPFLHVPLLVTIGALKDAVIPVDGKPAVRKVVTVTATLDHRCVDGAGAGVLAKVLRAVFASPDLMLGPPSAATA